MFLDIEKNLTKKKFPVLFNMGELADSRAWDHLTEFSKTIVPFIANTKNGYLYMLSKSGNYKNFIGLEHRDKQGRTRVIQVASVNAPIVCELIEEKTPSLEDRIDAMRKLQEDGYKIRYRIDPIMPLGELFYNDLITEDENFRKTTEMYEPTLDMVFSMTHPELITLGTYRPYPGLQHYLSRRFPNSCVLGIKTHREGSKKHIDKRFRIRIYTWFKLEIQKRSLQTKVALCKESPEIWKVVGLNFKPLRCSCALY
jgi:spore photoproduct lyase